ncbi:hypothetical protein GCM10010254_29690 [Streptomyces chromofuscus]|nr:hypothetical protein GCM10010254_29690 [Streptomyces chromofuscus]
MPDVPRLPALLLGTVLGVGADLDPRATLQRIVDGAAELTGARHAALQTRGPGDDGLHESRWAGLPAPPPDADTLDGPIHVGDEEFGHLHLAGKHGGGPFTAEDAQPLRILAAQAGIALGNARLYEAARQRERWIEAWRPSSPPCSAAGVPTTP